MTSLQQFIAMGGYALYVWTAYGIAAALLGFNAISAVMNYKQTKRRLQRSK